MVVIDPLRLFRDEICYIGTGLKKKEGIILIEILVVFC